jgi:hypothetical protein
MHHCPFTRKRFAVLLVLEEGDIKLDGEVSWKHKSSSSKAGALPLLNLKRSTGMPNAFWCIQITRSSHQYVHLSLNSHLSFRELALQRKLSVQFTHILGLVLNGIAGGPPPAGIDSPSLGTMDDLLTNPDIHAVERVLAVALICCSLFTARAHGMVHPLVELFIQAHARSFPSGRETSSDGLCEEEALDWAALVFYFTVEKGSVASTWAINRMVAAPWNLFVESHQRKLQEVFFIIPGWVEG